MFSGNRALWGQDLATTACSAKWMMAPSYVCPSEAFNLSIGLLDMYNQPISFYLDILATLSISRPGQLVGQLVVLLANDSFSFSEIELVGAGGATYSMFLAESNGRHDHLTRV